MAEGTLCLSMHPCLQYKEMHFSHITTWWCQRAWNINSQTHWCRTLTTVHAYKQEILHLYANEGEKKKLYPLRVMTT